MDYYNSIDYIGNNIKVVRHMKNMTQKELGALSDMADTVISNYETGKSSPGLESLARIASALNVSIDRLYYGDENEAFINKEKNVGRIVVNCIYKLWEFGVIDYNHIPPKAFLNKDSNISLLKYSGNIERLLMKLDDYKQNIDSFPDASLYLEQLLASSANMINVEYNLFKK